MCIKWDSAILFSLILSWQPCNTALLHNWIATLGTVSSSSPTKSRGERERDGETERLVRLCVCGKAARERLGKIRFHTKAKGWGGSLSV